MQYSKIKYPMMFTKDMQMRLYDYAYSEEANKHLDQTIFKTEEARHAWRDGLIWAGVYASTHCFQFGDAMVSNEEVEYYDNLNK